MIDDEEFILWGRLVFLSGFLSMTDTEELHFFWRELLSLYPSWWSGEDVVHSVSIGGFDDSFTVHAHQILHGIRQ